MTKWCQWHHLVRRQLTGFRIVPAPASDSALRAVCTGCARRCQPKSLPSAAGSDVGAEPRSCRSKPSLRTAWFLRKPPRERPDLPHSSATHNPAGLGAGGATGTMSPIEARREKTPPQVDRFFCDKRIICWSILSTVAKLPVATTEKWQGTPHLAFAIGVGRFQ
jgi:hypothetical protein